MYIKLSIKTIQSVVQITNLVSIYLKTLKKNNIVIN